jgi:hypothetical protein
MLRVADFQNKKPRISHLRAGSFTTVIYRQNESTEFISEPMDKRINFGSTVLD